MSLPRSVAELLRQHVTLVVEGIDRMYLNVYQPQLLTDRGVAAFFRFHRGETFASSALMNPMSKSFIAAVDRFVEQGQIPLITFTKGQDKDAITQQYRSRFRRVEGIVVVGKAQEKTPVFRTEKRRNPETGRAYPWIVRTTAMVNHYYFYGIDEDFGPFFLKFCTSTVSATASDGSSTAARLYEHDGDKTEPSRCVLTNACFGGFAPTDG